MKNNIFKGLLSLILAVMVLPTMSQDFMNIYFKNGDFRKFYMKNITEITASKYDADGVQHSDYEYQCITTIHDKYIYALEDVDSITFTKIDEEQAEENFASAMTTIFPTIDACETIEDAEEKIDEIKHAEGVADAWSDGHQLYVSVSGGEVVSFHYRHNSMEEDNTIEDSESLPIKAKIAELKNAIKDGSSNLKIAIVNQQHKDEDRKSQKEDYFDPTIETLRKCGFEAHYIRYPTVDFFYNNSGNTSNLNFYDYDIILLSTHGGYGYSRYYSPTSAFIDNYKIGLKFHSFETSEDIDMFKSGGEDDHGESINFGEKWLNLYKKFKRWRDDLGFKDVNDQHINYTFQNELRDGTWQWVVHPELSEFFFRDIAVGEFKNPNSFFFNCACESLKGDDADTPSYRFANALLEHRGLGAYAGYTESNRFGQKAGTYILNYMIVGASLETAFNELDDYMRHETNENIMNSNMTDKKKKFYINDGMDNARLIILPENDDAVLSLFLVPTYTAFISNEQANQEYNQSRTVTLRGEVRSSNFSNNMDVLNTGFTIYNNQYSNDAIQDIEAQATSTGLFTAVLTDITPGQTYYYRAYTFDGLHHNYGEMYSFKIEEPTDNRELMETKTVNGTTYSIYKENIDKSDVHTNPDGWNCYRSKLTLDVTKNGTTTSHVVDDNIYLDESAGHHSGQTPCMIIDYETGKMSIFCNSKDPDYQYSMEGYCYVSPINNVRFTKETVFTYANWGWSPFFLDNDTIVHFSFAGYYALASVREDGEWNTYLIDQMYPDDFEAESALHDKILVVGN